MGKLSAQVEFKKNRKIWNAVNAMNTTWECDAAPALQHVRLFNEATACTILPISTFEI
jgi:hypothetical protein